jgi:hypothetical protein
LGRLLRAVVEQSDGGRQTVVAQMIVVIRHEDIEYQAA